MLGDRCNGGLRPWYLIQDSIQPLQGTVEVNLHPTRSAGDILAVVFGAPAFDKAKPNGAHLGQLVGGFKATTHRLRQELVELLVVKYLEAATWRYFADSGWVESMGVVAVDTLDEDAAVRHALGKTLTTDIVQEHTFPNVSSGVFNGGVSVHVGEEAEGEAVCTGAWLRVAVNDDLGVRGMEHLPHAVVQLIVGDGAPVLWLVVMHLGHIWADKERLKTY